MFRQLSPWMMPLAVLAVLWIIRPHQALTAVAEFESIAPKEAASRSDFLVIDVREPFELQEELGYIEGARNIPLGKILAGIGLEPELDKSVPILLVCRTGARSEQAAARAAALGFSQVYSLKGGMIAWNESGLKVIKAKAEAKKPSLQLNMTGVPCA